MDKIGLKDVISKYNGEGSIDEWLKQVELAKDLLGLEDMAKVIPLFAVYDQMDTGDKRSEERIKVELRKTFSITKFKSYEELCGTKWEPGTQ
ncbi:Uncharacterized protein FKW44_004530 [Caligus rogercresseyi]|uniref:Uncharacterized protein n=1 Tax=Caligus rogercresseyi TaxID=217165 RepID=A0A7T8HLR2_CALRO|nr:Uncharacterized protein FKW44_004530 [Caligus rogercresseyi]